MQKITIDRRKANNDKEKIMRAVKKQLIEENLKE